MKDLLERYAALLCDYSLELRPGQRLQVGGPPFAAPLATAIGRAAWSRGADATVDLRPEWAPARLAREGTDEQVSVRPSWELPLLERTDVFVYIWAAGNTSEAAEVDPARAGAQQRAARAWRELFDGRHERGELRWVGCGYPTPLGAQRAGMSTHAFERFVFDACMLSRPDPAAAWRELRDRQARLVERLGGVRELRVCAPGTDLLVPVEGRSWENSHGTQNMPDGEVFCCPHVGVEGQITFGVPSLDRGRTVRDVRLRFSGGEVVDASAAEGEEFVHELLAVDDGARRVGEFAIATNDAIRQPVGETLYDEKIGGTCHLALGSSFPELGGVNLSALHWDLVCDLRSGGRIEADGSVILDDGRLVL